MTSPDNMPRRPGHPDGSTPSVGDPGAPSPYDQNPTSPLGPPPYGFFDPRSFGRGAEQPTETRRMLPEASLPDGDPDKLIPVPGMRGVYQRAGDIADAERRAAAQSTNEDSGPAPRYPDVAVYPSGADPTFENYDEFEDGPIESRKKTGKGGLKAALGALGLGRKRPSHDDYDEAAPAGQEYQDDYDTYEDEEHTTVEHDNDRYDNDGYDKDGYDRDGYDKDGYNREGEFDFIGRAPRASDEDDGWGDYDDHEEYDEPTEKEQPAPFAVRAGSYAEPQPKTPRKLTRRQQRRLKRIFGEPKAERVRHPKESLATRAVNLKLRVDAGIANALTGGLQAYLTKGQYETNDKGEREYVRRLNTKGRLVTAAAIGITAFSVGKGLVEMITAMTETSSTGVNQDLLHQISGNKHGYPPVDPRHIGGGAPTTPEAPPVDTTTPAAPDTTHVGTGTGTGAHEPNIHETPPPATHDTSHDGIDTGAHEPTDPAHTGTTAPKTPETTPPETPGRDPQNLPTNQGHSNTPQEVPTVGDHDNPEIPVAQDGVLKLNAEHNSIWSQSEALLKQSHVPVNDHNLSSLSNRIRELSGNLSESQASHLKYGFEITVPDLRDPRLNFIK